MDFHNVRSKDKVSGKSQASGSNKAQKKNCFYALLSCGEKQNSPDVENGMLKAFSIDIYALFDPGATLSFVTPLVAKIFYTLPDILHEPFILSTSQGELVVTKRVYKKCPIMLPNRISFYDLAELDMFYFDIILVWICCMLGLPLLVVGQGW